MREDELEDGGEVATFKPWRLEDEDDDSSASSSSTTRQAERSQGGSGAVSGTAHPSPLRDPEDSKQKTPFFTFVASFFIIVATLLGTGILGLPVTIARSGIQPFILSYTLCLFMQGFAMLYILEVLQRAAALLDFDRRRSCNINGDSSHSGSGSSAEDHPDNSAFKPALEQGPDLHTLASLYLGRGPRLCFDVAIILHLISILISYGLAGSQAYAQFLGLPSSALPIVVTIFVVLLSSVLIFAAPMMHYLISVMTLAKGNLLVLLVIVTGIVRSQVDHELESSWLYIGDSWLISTVALGGSIALFPVIFSKVQRTRHDLIRLFIAALAALVVVFVLNVVWCYYVLEIVPRSHDEFSLERARENGEIATKPLIGIIDRDFPSYHWAGTVVGLFIMTSITVSYITLGAGTKHLLDGLVKNWVRAANSFQRSLSSPSSTPQLSWWQTLRRMALTQRGGVVGKQAFAYILCFGGVLLFSATNPKSFLIVIESGTSGSMNMSVVFVIWMVGKARAKDPRPDAIPFPVPPLVFHLRWLVMFYFLFAIFYDVANVFSEL